MSLLCTKGEILLLLLLLDLATPSISSAHSIILRNIICLHTLKLIDLLVVNKCSMSKLLNVITHVYEKYAFILTRNTGLLKSKFLQHLSFKMVKDGKGTLDA